MIENLINISIILIMLGLIGSINRGNNYLFIIISIELSLIGLSFLFILTTYIHDDMEGIITAIFILPIAAAETAIALSVLAKLNR